MGPPSPPSTSSPALTVLVAGCQRTGKTALVRLLLETAEVASSPAPSDLQTLVKFIHGAARPTSAFREAVLRVHGPTPTSEPIALRIIDSPGLDFEDEAELEHGLAALLRNIEARFSETAVANTPAAHDQHIHLCIYLLDPDDIIPETTRQAYRSGYARPKTAQQATSSDESDFESEDDGNGNSTRLRQRPSIPPAEIAAMKRLATRVNLLPVIARSDALTEARLRAIKRAVKRDLHHAGLSFGVFDPQHEKGSDPTRPSGPSPNSESAPSSVLPPTPVSPRHCDASHASLRPATEIASLLPFALVSPDRYSYGDGVVRRSAKKATLQEITAQFSPSKDRDAAKGKERDEPPGRFTRRYKWGTVDVLDPAHCDFVALKTAVLAIHRDALRAKTRDLFAQFIQDQRNIRTVNEDRRRNSDPLAPAWQHQYPTTQPSHGHHPQHSSSHHHPHSRDTNDGRYFGPPLEGSVGQFQTGGSDMYTRVIPLTVSRGPRAKTKKILVACNFCRSRKLKCDGGRPQCAQCQRRGLECSYEDTLKRRGVGRPPRDDESVNGEEEDTGTPGGSSNGQRVGGRERTDSRSGDGEMMSPGANRKISPANSRTMSPVTRRGSPAAVVPLPATGQIHVSYIPPRPLSVTSANVSIPTPPLGQSTDRHNHHHPPPPQPPPPPREQHRQHKHHSHPPGGPGTTMMVMAMPFPGSMGGSKATACSFCKTRKTKCDGHRPSCSNCRKKQVECFYPEDGRARQHHHQQHHQQQHHQHHGGGEDVKPRTGSAMSLEQQQQRERDRAQMSIDHAHAQAMHQHTFHQQPFQHHSLAGSGKGGSGRGGPGEGGYYPYHPHHMPPHPSHLHHPNHLKRSSSHSPPPPHLRYGNGSPPPVLPPIQPGSHPPGPGYHHRLPPPHSHSQPPPQLPLPALRNSNGPHPPPPPGYHHHPRSPQPYYRSPPPPGSGSPPRPGSSGVDRPPSRAGRSLSRHMSPPRSTSRSGIPMEIDQDVRDAPHGSVSSFAKRKSVDESLSPAFKRARVDDRERDGFDRDRHDWSAPSSAGHEGGGMNGHGHHYYSDRERFDADRERYEAERERYETERERYERDRDRARFDLDRERYEAERERYEAAERERYEADRERYDADRERERYEAERERREPLSAERYEQPQPPISADRYDHQPPTDRYDQPPISADRYEPYERPTLPPPPPRAGSPTIRSSVEKERESHVRYAPSLRHRTRSRSRSNESAAAIAATATVAATVAGGVGGAGADGRRGGAADVGGGENAARRPGVADVEGGRRSGDGHMSPQELRTAAGDGRLVESRYLPPPIPILQPLGTPGVGGQWNHGSSRQAR